MFPGGLDPSKLSPELLAELTAIVRELPQEKLMQMQTLMHNMMAGIDNRKELEEFEKSLPPGFREKMAKFMYRAHGVNTGGESTEHGGNRIAGLDQSTAKPTMPGNINEARLTVLKAVASGSMNPEEALGVLFKD